MVWNKFIDFKLNDFPGSKFEDILKIFAFVGADVNVMDALNFRALKNAIVKENYDYDEFPNSPGTDLNS